MACISLSSLCWIKFAFPMAWLSVQRCGGGGCRDVEWVVLGCAVSVYWDVEWVCARMLSGCVRGCGVGVRGC